MNQPLPQSQHSKLDYVLAALTGSARNCFLIMLDDGASLLQLQEAAGQMQMQIHGALQSAAQSAAMTLGPTMPMQDFPQPPPQQPPDNDEPENPFVS